MTQNAWKKKYKTIYKRVDIVMKLNNNKYK